MTHYDGEVVYWWNFFCESLWKHDEKQFCKTMFPYGNTGRITGHFLTTIDINVINFYCRIICCHNFHCCCRQGCNHFLGGGGSGWGGGGGSGWRGGGVGTSNFFIAPQFWTAFNVGDRFNSFVLNVFLFSLKSRFFQDFLFNYTPDWTIWNLKFRKFSGKRLTEPLPQTHPPLVLRLRPRFPYKLNTF